MECEAPSEPAFTNSMNLWRQKCPPSFIIHISFLIVTKCKSVHVNHTYFLWISYNCFSCGAHAAAWHVCHNTCTHWCLCIHLERMVYCNINTTLRWGEVRETCIIVRGCLKGVQTPCTLSGAFEARVYQYTLGYIRAPWQLWCPFQNCEHIIDNYRCTMVQLLHIFIHVHFNSPLSQLPCFL